MHRQKDHGSYVRRSYQTVRVIEGVDLDGGDELARAEITSCCKSIEELNEHLDSLANPACGIHGRRHSSGSLSDERSRSRYLSFATLEVSHHKNKELPHFHELRVKWEGIRDGREQTFAQMRYKLQKQAKDKQEKDEDDKKAESKKEEHERKVKQQTEDNEENYKNAKKKLQDKNAYLP